MVQVQGQDKLLDLEFINGVTSEDKWGHFLGVDALAIARIEERLIIILNVRNPIR